MFTFVPTGAPVTYQITQTVKPRLDEYDIESEHVARDLVSGKEYSVLRYHDEIPDRATKEVAALTSLRPFPSPHVVGYFGAYQGDRIYDVVTERLDSTLKDMLHNTGPMQRQTMRGFLRQLLQGVAHLHTHMLMHRSISPETIYFTPEPQVLKIAKFGSARSFGVMPHDPHDLSVHHSYLCYQAPEMILGVGGYTQSVDMWAVGCVMAEMMRGGHPLFGRRMYMSKLRSDMYDQLETIFSILGTPSFNELGIEESDWPFVRAPTYQERANIGLFAPSLDVNGIDLLQRLLEYNPLNRITAAAALNHAFFQ